MSNDAPQEWRQNACRWAASGHAALMNEPSRAAMARWLSRITTNTVILRCVRGTWTVDGTHQPSTAFVPPLQQSLYPVAEETDVECLARR